MATPPQKDGPHNNPDDPHDEHNPEFEALIDLLGTDDHDDQPPFDQDENGSQDSITKDIVPVVNLRRPDGKFDFDKIREHFQRTAGTEREREHVGFSVLPERPIDFPLPVPHFSPSPSIPSIQQNGKDLSRLTQSPLSLAPYLPPAIQNPPPETLETVEEPTLDISSPPLPSPHIPPPSPNPAPSIGATSFGPNATTTAGDGLTSISPLALPPTRLDDERSDVDGDSNISTPPSGSGDISQRRTATHRLTQTNKPKARKGSKSTTSSKGYSHKHNHAHTMPGKEMEKIAVLERLSRPATAPPDVFHSSYGSTKGKEPDFSAPSLTQPRPIIKLNKSLSKLGVGGSLTTSRLVPPSGQTKAGTSEEEDYIGPSQLYTRRSSRDSKHRSSFTASQRHFVEDLRKVQEENKRQTDALSDALKTVRVETDFLRQQCEELRELAGHWRDINRPLSRSSIRPPSSASLRGPLSPASGSLHLLRQPDQVALSPVRSRPPSRQLPMTTSELERSAQRQDMVTPQPLVQRSMEPPRSAGQFSTLTFDTWSSMDSILDEQGGERKSPTNVSVDGTFTVTEIETDVDVSAQDRSGGVTSQQGYQQQREDENGTRTAHLGERGDEMPEAPTPTPGLFQRFSTRPSNTTDVATNGDSRSEPGPGVIRWTNTREPSPPMDEMELMSGHEARRLLRAVLNALSLPVPTLPPLSSSLASSFSTIRPQASPQSETHAIGAASHQGVGLLPPPPAPNTIDDILRALAFVQRVDQVAWGGTQRRSQHGGEVEGDSGIYSERNLSRLLERVELWEGLARRAKVVSAVKRDGVKEGGSAMPVSGIKI
ncbi:hypothetical protein FRB99_007598 [Tulasnella sp. 403]|nr:hypothetical protein FRB99_007598 [Tulasnella sp. 403]